MTWLSSGMQRAVLASDSVKLGGHLHCHCQCVTVYPNMSFQAHFFSLTWLLGRQNKLQTQKPQATTIVLTGGRGWCKS